MSDRHVVPAEDGWQIEKDGAKRASAKAPTQAEAIKRALEIVANDGGGEVVVHGSDGTVRETRTVTAEATGTTAQAAATAVSAAAKGAKATADKASATVSDTVDATAADARRTAKKAAATVAETGREVAEDLGAARRRAGARVEKVADEAGDALVAGADRAAEVGAGVGDQLEDASQRAGRYIHSFTEQVARPLDAASQALNPLRITGRTVGVVVAGALHVGAVITSRGTRRARRSARSVTGRR